MQRRPSKAAVPWPRIRRLATASARSDLAVAEYSTLTSQIKTLHVMEWLRSGRHVLQAAYAPPLLTAMQPGRDGVMLRRSHRIISRRSKHLGPVLNFLVSVGGRQPRSALGR